MSITSAVANAAALAAAGAGKKAAQVQLQAEINTDDEWAKFLNRDGLLVIDVYTEWCGPCIGMVGNLKKIKVEIGGDNLHLAIAKADTIRDLKRFRNRSEPTWMLLSNKQLLNVVFGADAPRLTRTIEQELKNEELVRKGELERPQRAPYELTPQEQEVAIAQEKLLQARRAKEAAAAENSRLARRESRAKRLEAHFNEICPAMLTPHAQKHLRKVADTLEPFGVVVADKCPLVLNKEGLKVLAIEDEHLASEAAAAALIDRPSLTLLLKKLPDKQGNVIELCRSALFGDGLSEENEPKKFLADELHLNSVPGLFVPADRHQRAAALDLLFPKMVGSLVEPPTPAEPPHLLMLFGAWQRRAILSVAVAPKFSNQILRYGFFADANIDEPKLLAKNIDKYEERPEKDYSETIALMVSVGVEDPALVDPSEIQNDPPDALLTLGPLHVSEDTVVGEEECRRFIPPGYSEPEHKPKPKSKKKKKKRNETRDEGDEMAEVSTEVSEDDIIDGSAEDGDLEDEGEEKEEDIGRGEKEDDSHLDKATSPPPTTH
ncbi:uncharacterized protein LOC123708613 isoform X1 [Pieris brassicae]|uniref:uncharacterized protein LOC123708613 isoform X1 n=1 Tax=Pieris brassicae TaxID=7116 RepID=UPI001E65F103|nr:uncharacterized protein LOC123708613 isoform X1 [Pieris brassicae]